MELVSVNVQQAIHVLLHIHTLANMARGSDSTSARKEHMQSAERWLPTLERLVTDIREIIAREVA